MRKEIAIGFAVILIAIGVFFGRSLLHLSDPKGAPESAKPTAEMATGAVAPPPAVNAGAGSLPSSNVAKVNSAPTGEVAFSHQNELNTFAALQAKVLPSENEKEQRAALLKNVGFMRAVGARLIQRPLLPLGEQGVAIDYLLEALRGDEKAVAAEVLNAVVIDPQVEDESLPREDREQLGGIKGEILYHWAAASPDAAAVLPGRLPGPVSRKIWDNVVDSHESNRVESEAEAAKAEEAARERSRK